VWIRSGGTCQPLPIKVHPQHQERGAYRHDDPSKQITRCRFGVHLAAAIADPHSPPLPSLLDVLHPHPRPTAWAPRRRTRHLAQFLGAGFHLRACSDGHRLDGGRDALHLVIDEFSEPAALATVTEHGLPRRERIPTAGAAPACRASRAADISRARSGPAIADALRWQGVGGGARSWPGASVSFGAAPTLAGRRTATVFPGSQLALASGKQGPFQTPLSPIPLTPPLPRTSSPSTPISPRTRPRGRSPTA
jgi:hypothetical protein